MLLWWSCWLVRGPELPQTRRKGQCMPPQKAATPPWSSCWPVSGPASLRQMSRNYSPCTGFIVIVSSLRRIKREQFIFVIVIVYPRFSLFSCLTIINHYHNHNFPDGRKSKEYTISPGSWTSPNSINHHLFHKYRCVPKIGSRSTTIVVSYHFLLKVSLCT